MKQIYKGKLKLRIARECPYYGTAGRTLHKVLFYKFGISVSLWIYYDTTFPEYTEYAINKISKIFPGGVIDEYSNVHWNQKTYYRDNIKWMLNDKLDLKPTASPQVMFDEKSNYYKSRKYRRKYLLTLLKYHLKDNWIMFEDLCEDDTIGHGIMQVVPFVEKGNKKIEVQEEAFEAAKSFAEHIS